MNRELFDANVTSVHWQKYVDYLDAMVVDGFAHLIGQFNIRKVK